MSTAYTSFDESEFTAPALACNDTASLDSNPGKVKASCQVSGLDVCSPVRPSAQYVYFGVLNRRV